MSKSITYRVDENAGSTNGSAMTGAVVGRSVQDVGQEWSDADFREFVEKPEVKENIRSAVRAARLEHREGRVPA